MQPQAWALPVRISDGGPGKGQGEAAGCPEDGAWGALERTCHVRESLPTLAAQPLLLPFFCCFCCFCFLNFKFFQEAIFLQPAVQV